MTASNPFSLRGRTALLTGAAGHLGSSMARALVQAECTVVLNDLDAAALGKLRDELVSGGGQAHVALADIRDEAAVEKMLKTLPGGELHVLINNAYAGPGGTLATATAEEFQSTYEIAVTAAFNLMKAARALLVAAVARTGDASIVNIASMYGVVSPRLDIYDSPPGSNPPFYGAAKAALIQLARYAACELAVDGIRVNAISPGPFPRDAVATQDPDLVKRITARTPLARIGRPEELAAAVVFLASPASSYVTGANLPVDGGWTAW